MSLYYVVTTLFYNFIKQVGVAVWPLLQVFNYTMIPEKNRIPFVSLCSLAWSSFLAYMNHCSVKKENTLTIK
jgi:protein Mpv17